MPCVFESCEFKTNIYGTFASHRSRRHNPHSLDDFKPTIVQRYGSPSYDNDKKGDDEDAVFENTDNEDATELPHLIQQNIGHLLLKMESIYNVPQRCIDEVVEKMHFISSSASSCTLKEIIDSCLKKHNCDVEESIITEIVTDLCNNNPLTLALDSKGPLSTSYKRKQYFKDNFAVVEPVEYLLSAKEYRRKHKVIAVYWVLGNVPPLLRLSLTSIYLAILCKAEDIKSHGYNVI